MPFRLCERRFPSINACLFERRFFWVVAFSPLQAMFSLHKRISDPRKQRRKRVHRAKTWLAKKITPLPTKNLAGKVKKGFMERKAASQIRKRFYRAKTQTRKRGDGANTCFPNENVFSERKRSLEKPKTLLPSENVARTGENPSTERKMRYPNENVTRKWENELI